MGDAAFDIDGSTARAWRQFTARLGDFLADMQECDVLLVGTLHELDEGAGATPYVQVLNWGGDRLRGEVCGNAYLAPQFWLDAEDESALLDLGWSAPEADRETTTENWFHLTDGGVDELAVMAVGALREVYGVEHPALLVVSGHGSDDAPDLGIPVAQMEAGAEDAHDETVLVIPDSPDELQEAVDAAMAILFERELEKDEDGDIPVVCGTAVLYVRVREEEPTIDLFSTLVDDITDHDAAVREVAILNRDTPFFKFVLVDDRVVARYQLPALPFAPWHLRNLVSKMVEMLEGCVDDLAGRTGGRRWLHVNSEEVDESGDPDEPEDEAAEERPPFPGRGER